jgi:hypothetical protein
MRDAPIRSTKRSISMESTDENRSASLTSERRSAESEAISGAFRDSFAALPGSNTKSNRQGA